MGGLLVLNDYFLFESSFLASRGRWGVYGVIHATNECLLRGTAHGTPTPCTSLPLGALLIWLHHQHVWRRFLLRYHEAWEVAYYALAPQNLGDLAIRRRQ